eukprot:COSAG02_NODE_1360_length_13055_cov_9.008567_7_plen_107_part_00
MNGKIESPWYTCLMWQRGLLAHFAPPALSVIKITQNGYRYVVRTVHTHFYPTLRAARAPTQLQTADHLYNAQGATRLASSTSSAASLDQVGCHRCNYTSSRGSHGG